MSYSGLRVVWLMAAMLAGLPAGAYSLTAAYDGQTQARKVSVVTGHLRTEYIRWKSNPRTDTVLPPDR